MTDFPKLSDLNVLCEVVKHGSFSEAARRLGTTQPQASRAVRRLEALLGVTLLRRTSRQVAPTSAGAACVEKAQAMLREYHELEASLFDDERNKGTIALSAPPSVGRRILMPLLAEFGRVYPDIKLEVSLRAERVDLIADEFDVAIRFGPLQPTWRRARKLFSGVYRVYASPDFIATHEIPPSPDGLGDLPALILNATHLRDRWPLSSESGLVWKEVSPVFVSDDMDALIQICCGGLGVTMSPDFLVQKEVNEGWLVPLWEDVEALPAEVFVVTEAPERPMRVETLLAYLFERL